VEENYHSAKKLVGGRLLEDQYSNNIARLLQANYSLNKLHNVRSIHEWTCEELIVHQVSITHTLDLVLNLILCLKARILPHEKIVLINNYPNLHPSGQQIADCTC
jgi:hypothetical protein